MVKLILICGTSFAGKSTLARSIVDRFGHVEVDVDVTKAELFGADVADEALARADWERIYRETDQRLADHLAAGQSVVTPRGTSAGPRPARPAGLSGRTMPRW